MTHEVQTTPAPGLRGPGLHLIAGTSSCNMPCCPAVYGIDSICPALSLCFRAFLYVCDSFARSCVHNNPAWPVEHNEDVPCPTCCLESAPERVSGPMPMLWLCFYSPSALRCSAGSSHMRSHSLCRASQRFSSGSTTFTAALACSTYSMCMLQARARVARNGQRSVVSL